MTVGAFIVVRLSSSRLPNKGIMKIMNKPLIELMVERVQESQKIDKTIIATSNHPSDEPLEVIAKRLGVGCYRGSLKNVMGRIVNAANAYDCDVIVELLGDNPLIHSDLIDDVVRFYQKGGYDYAASVTNEYPVDMSKKRMFSLGVRVQVYSLDAAKRHVDYPEYADDESRGYSAYMFEHPEMFKRGYFEAKDNWTFMNRPYLNFAVNYQKNFNLIRSIFEKNYPEDSNFPLEKVFKQLDEERYLYLLMGSE